MQCCMHFSTPICGQNSSRSSHSICVCGYLKIFFFLLMWSTLIGQTTHEDEGPSSNIIHLSLSLHITQLSSIEKSILWLCCMSGGGNELLWVHTLQYFCWREFMFSWLISQKISPHFSVTHSSILFHELSTLFQIYQICLPLRVSHEEPVKPDGATASHWRQPARGSQSRLRELQHVHGWGPPTAAPDPSASHLYPRVATE